ncbi:MAG: hypothetical protein DRG31_05970 [Deltaproteobacteria bacterium]|nr:MAG: hypothetical protein DRG31_05970 [Deltaproteobacteria bacterium]
MRRLWVWIVAFTLLGALPVEARSIKIGYVDVQRVLSESRRGQEAKARIEARGAELDRRFQQMQREVKALKEEIEKKGSLMSESALRERQRQYEQKVRQLEDFVRDSRQELQEMERQMVSDLLKEIEGIIAEIGKKEGYTLILEKHRSFILYAPEEIDLTEEVIKALDSKGK